MPLFKKFFTTLGLFLSPLGVLAQGRLDASNVTSLAESTSGFINGRLIPLFVLMALAYTVYAVVDFIAAKENSQDKDEKKQRIFWGIIGLFVIVSIWGLVAVIGRTFGIFPGGVLTVN